MSNIAVSLVCRQGLWAFLRWRKFSSRVGKIHRSPLTAVRRLMLKPIPLDRGRPSSRRSSKTVESSPLECLNGLMCPRFFKTFNQSFSSGSDLWCIFKLSDGNKQSTLQSSGLKASFRKRLWYICLRHGRLRNLFQKCATVTSPFHRPLSGVDLDPHW